MQHCQRSQTGRLSDEERSLYRIVRDRVVELELDGWDMVKNSKPSPWYRVFKLVRRSSVMLFIIDFRLMTASQYRGNSLVWHYDTAL